jgi:hypothetical protein
MTGILVLAAASDPRPDDNNVVAGWVGFAVVMALIIAVVFVLRSFTKQLKKVDAAEQAGVYDESAGEGAEKDDQQAGDGSTPPSTVEQER